MDTNTPTSPQTHLHAHTHTHLLPCIFIFPAKQTRGKVRAVKQQRLFPTFCLVSELSNVSIVQCTVFGRWSSQRSWRTDLLGVVKWRVLVFDLLGTTVWQGQLYLRRRTEGLDQTQCCHCISDSPLAYRLHMPLATNRSLHYNSALVCVLMKDISLRT